MRADFGSLLTAMITPMQHDGSVDLKGAARLAKHLVENGSDGVVVGGTTGESPTLTHREKLELFATVLEAVGDRAKVIAGTGSYATAESVNLTREAAQLGVHGIMAVVPYYNKPPQEGLYRHFRAIAEATSLPVMLYNVPGRTSCNLLPETVARLAEIPNITCIKEASGSLEQVAQVRARTPEGFAIYSGDDGLTLPILAVGGVGVVSVASHVAGPEIKSMIAAYREGRVAEAEAWHRRLLPLFKTLFITTNPIPVKAACRLLGLPAGPLRLPLVEPSEGELAQIRECLQRGGWLRG